MTSWCDKLASTPSLGLGFEPFYVTSAVTLGTLAPLMNQWGGGKLDTFAIEKQDTFSFVLHKNDGFQYAVEPSKMSVEFKHRLKLKAVSGSYPQMEMLSKPSPFTELLPKVAKALFHAYGLVDPKGGRILNRIGVVSTTYVNKSDTPPGILKFIKRMSSPWPKGLQSYAISITGVVDENDEFRDQCIHNVAVNADDANILNLVFDFQRIYKKPAPAGSDKVAQMVPDVTAAALAYFETLAEGDIFDDSNK